MSERSAGMRPGRRAFQDPWMECITAGARGKSTATNFVGALLAPYPYTGGDRPGRHGISVHAHPLFVQQVAAVKME